MPLASFCLHACLFLFAVWQLHACRHSLCISCLRLFLTCCCCRTACTRAPHHRAPGAPHRLASIFLTTLLFLLLPLSPAYSLPAMPHLPPLCISFCLHDMPLHHLHPLTSARLPCCTFSHLSATLPPPQDPSGSPGSQLLEIFIYNYYDQFSKDNDNALRCLLTGLALSPHTHTHTCHLPPPPPAHTMHCMPHLCTSHLHTFFTFHIR